MSLVENDVTVFEEVETGGVTIPIMRKGSVSNPTISIRSLSSPTQFDEAGTISQESIRDIPDSRILTTPEKFDLLQKLPTDHTTLGESSSFYQGIITGDNKKFLSERKESERHQRVVRGRDVHRYIITWGGNHILFDEDELWSNTNREKFEITPKLLIRQTADKLVTAVDNEGFFSIDSTLLIHPDQHSAKYISALLNSKVLNWYYQTIVPEEGEAFSQVKIANIKQLPIADGSQSDVEKIEEKYSEIKSYKERSVALNLSLPDYLGTYTDGELLGERYQPPAGLADSILTATTADYENLRIGTVSIAGEGSKLVVRATARYKPENPDAHETDRWGYTETDPLDAMEFVGLPDAERELVEAFVPHAINDEDDFNENATKTISPLDRLEGLALPALSDVEDGLERYLDAEERATELDKKIEKTDNLIDQIVYELYGLTDEEIEIVEEAVGDD